jgi:adenosine 3'-phospho 5'-phosphosulfate transporter B3
MASFYTNKSKASPPPTAAVANANNNTNNTNNKQSLLLQPMPEIDEPDMAAGQNVTTTKQRKHSNGNGNNMNNNNMNNNNNNNNMNNKLLTTAPSSGMSSSVNSSSVNSINTDKGYPDDLDFYEDLVSEPVLVLGMDISHLDRQAQFYLCATGVFCFSLLYGYLQELIAVELCGRQLGLFLAVMQFSGYTVLSYFLRTYVYAKQQQMNVAQQVVTGKNYFTPARDVPLATYLGLSLLRAVDLGMTNTAMQYINYPAKTLMKSSRVVFTMLFGVVIGRKSYHYTDYGIVVAMVAGLALFMHADANSSAVFHHVGVVMLTTSLVCDGAISNMSENIMSNYGVGQDEFIFRMYSIALVAISLAAAYKGDLQQGIVFMSQPGKYVEIEMHVPLDERTWSVPGKIAVMVLFSSMGFFGSSCSACITKNFGALTMSITSTARKATTLFLSFFLFNNICTGEHLVGISVFITALTAKSLRRGRTKQKKKGGGGGSSSTRRKRKKTKQKSSTSAALQQEVPVQTLMERSTSTDTSSTGGAMRRPTSTPSRDTGDGGGVHRQGDYTIAGLNIV